MGLRDYGRASGVLGGLSEGIDKFLEFRRQNQLDEQNKNFQEAGLLKSGLMKDPTTGHYALTPEAEEAQHAGLLKSQADQADFSAAPDSAIALRKALIKNFGLPDIDMSGMSMHDIRTNVDPQMDVGAKLYASKAAKDAAKITNQGTKDRDLLFKAQGALNSDKEYGESLKSRNDVDKAIDLANQAHADAQSGKPNGLARNMLAPLIIPTITGLKRVNQQELQAAAGSPDVGSTINRYAAKLQDGSMTDDDYKDMMGVLTTAKKGSDSAYEDSILRHVTQYQRLTKKQKEEAAFDLGVDLPKEKAQKPGGLIPQAPSGVNRAAIIKALSEAQ